MEERRREIDHLDEQIRILFQKRMVIVEEIGKIKKAKGLKIEDRSREIAMIERNIAKVPEELRVYYKELLEKMIELSKRYQSRKNEL